jgi:hypothetical protein
LVSKPVPLAGELRIFTDGLAPLGRSRVKGFTDPMNVKIKVSVEFGVSDSALEDAMAEYDELTVAGLLREIIDKAIACDEISTNVEDGPNTLEEYDQLISGSAAPAGGGA